MDPNSLGLQWIMMDLHGYAWRVLEFTAMARRHMDAPGNHPNSEACMHALQACARLHSRYTICHAFSSLHK